MEHRWQYIAVGGSTSETVTFWCARCGAICKRTVCVQTEHVEPDVRRVYHPIGGTWTAEEPPCREVADDEALRQG